MSKDDDNDDDIHGRVATAPAPCRGGEDRVCLSVCLSVCPLASSPELHVRSSINIVMWRGTVVERRSLAGELSLSCARPAADG